MPCIRTATGFICSRGPREKKTCYICGKPATALCDYPIGSFLSCDKPMCKEHDNNIGPDNDVCDEHFNEIAVEKAKRHRKQMGG